MTSYAPVSPTPSCLTRNYGHSIERDLIDIRKVIKNPIARSDPNCALLFIFCYNRNMKPVGTIHRTVFCDLRVRLKQFVKQETDTR